MEKFCLSSTLFYLPPPHACLQTKAPERSRCSGSGRAAASRSAVPASFPAISALRGKKKEKWRRKKNRPTENFSPLRLRAGATESIPTARLPSAAPPEGSAAPRASQVPRSSVGGDRNPRGQRASRPGRFTGQHDSFFPHLYRHYFARFKCPPATWRPSLLVRQPREPPTALTDAPPTPLPQRGSARHRSPALRHAGILRPALTSPPCRAGPAPGARHVGGCARGSAKRSRPRRPAAAVARAPPRRVGRGPAAPARLSSV